MRGLDRLGLHCWYLELPPLDVHCGDAAGADHDDENKIIQCVAPLTQDISDALRHKGLKSLWSEAIRVEPRLSMETYDERGGSFGRHYSKWRMNNRPLLD